MDTRCTAKRLDASEQALLNGGLKGNPLETTEAWVLKEGPKTRSTNPDIGLSCGKLVIPPLDDDEALLEPLFGAWEGNYGHALDRSPIDICVARGEPAVVLGNCGVVRVLRPPKAPGELKPGDICIQTGNAVADRFGYMVKAHAYDARNTMGVLAKRTKARARQLIRLGPDHQVASLPQWAAFSLRYVTAWANWRVAHGSFRLQLPVETFPEAFPVWAWGGGVAYAELQLAAHFGARCTLISSKASRLAEAEAAGFAAVDRRSFSDLDYDPKAYKMSDGYRERYRAAERAFLEVVAQGTGGEGASIFIDNIGGPVFRASLKALAREGVLTTAGWKCGMNVSYMRAMQCIARQTFVHTHYASFEEGRQAVRYAVEHEWLPPSSALSKTYAWHDIGQLSLDFNADRVDSYFPIFAINPL